MSEATVVPQGVPKDRQCWTCGHMIVADEKECAHCKSGDFKLQCVVCGKNLPYKAKYCNECKSYQGRVRRHFGVSQLVLALLGALITASIPAVNSVRDFINRDSKTQIAIQSSTSDEIVISAINTGRSPSLLRDFRLISGNPGILDHAELELVTDPKADPKLPINIVPANGGLTIRLKTSGLRIKVARGKFDIEKQLPRMTLEVDIQESDDSKVRLRDSFRATRIEAFILGNATYERTDRNQS